MDKYIIQISKCSLDAEVNDWFNDEVTDKVINVNLKMYTFDYLRMYKYDYINLCYKWDRCGLFVYSDILNNLASCFIQIFN